MIGNTKEFLTVLNRNKILIEELFEKRDRDVYLNDIASDINFSEKIEYFVNVGILESEEEPFVLNDVLISFLENMLETNRRVEIQVVNEDLEYLKNKISDYKNRDLIHKQKEYLREIKRTLLRINKTIMMGFKVISERVTLEYTTQTNYIEKIIELNRYRKKIEELISAEKEVDYIIIRELEFFKKSHNKEILQVFYQLSNTLRELRISLVELQQIVIDYINKSQEKKAFFEKVLKLREMIKNQEIKQKTDIEELIQQDRYRQLFIVKEKSFKTQLSLDAVHYYEDEFEERVKRVIFDIEISQKIVQKAPKITEELLSSSIEYSNEVDKYALQRVFRGTSLDLFTFLDNKQYQIEMSLEDKLLIYAQMITLFEQEYDYTDKYKLYDNYKILDIYNKIEQRG
ncbi:MAG: Unknown protein [uncultured Sulfurovum sp.]|uniref:Uncharacterized protein n=1 Tax=uncultured Sulfurovum sp. TaxID=269237 RepID=A0A6S6RSY4_9BACT|nr:MAG: Unknown protein [uncultured Sulfurovum sp.]